MDKKCKAEEGGSGGDGAGQSEETVDYESHQVINDFINRTNHAAVIGVTQGWGMILSPCSIPPPTTSHLPPYPSDIASLLPRQGAGEKGMEHSVDRGGGSGVGEGEMGGRKVKIHFETHFQLGVHKLLSQVSQNGGP